MSVEVLIVEDDAAIRASIRLALASGGLTVATAESAAAARRSALREAPQLVLLDLGLPDADGFATCAALRQLIPNAVIVMLTARSSEIDVVAALEAGADDYLTKPFKLLELLARVRAHLRRPGGRRSDRAEALVVGDLSIEIDARIAMLAGTVMPLRNREFDLLVRLAEDAGRAVPSAVLVADVWDSEWDRTSKTLDVHVLSLRRKLAGADDGHGRVVPTITTLRGHGYRLDGMI